jgi:hypothetical protein
MQIKPHIAVDVIGKAYGQQDPRVIKSRNLDISNSSVNNRSF